MPPLVYGRRHETLVDKMRFQYSIAGYVALLASIASLGMFTASLFLQASSDGTIGLGMLLMGLFGLVGAAPSVELWAYSTLGMLLNLTLLVAVVRRLITRKAGRPLLRIGGGVFLLIGFLFLTLLPARNSDGAIGYRTWVNSFLLGSVGLLLPVSDKTYEDQS